MSTRKVIRGGLWLYARSLANNLTGYAYWFIVSRIAGAEALGISSATVSLATLVSSALSLGVPGALQRFLGLTIGKGDKERLSEYFWSAAAFFLLTRLCAGAALLLAGLAQVRSIGLDPEMLKYAGLLVMLGWTMVLDSLLISYLKTKLSALSYIAGSLAKLAVGITLVWLGWGWTGVVLGYVASSVVTGAGLMVYSSGLVLRRPIVTWLGVAEVLRAGLSIWLPGIITLVGQQVGVLAVFGARGGFETGTYYASFAIAGVVWAFPMLMLSLLVPVLSGMEDGRKRATWRTLRLATAISAPLSAFLLAYPDLPLSLLGRDYLTASTTLRVLALSAIPTTIVAGVSSLVFSYGLYGVTLEIGIAQSIPRLMLYLTLTPAYGGLGAALAFTTGSFVGLLAVLSACRSIGFTLDARVLSLASLPPLCLAFVLSLLHLHWLVGVPLLFAATLIFYARARVLSRADAKELALAVIPAERLPALSGMLKWLDRVLFGSDSL